MLAFTDKRVSALYAKSILCTPLFSGPSWNVEDGRANQGSESYL
jgi:hypothetical protein